jgi:BolA protein
MKEQKGRKMTRADKIYEKLSQAFTPQLLEVVNESEQHRGHSGYSDGQSHFRVKLVTSEFAGQSRIARHRSVHAALGAELVAEIHALALELSEK